MFLSKSGDNKKEFIVKFDDLSFIDSNDKIDGVLLNKIIRDFYDNNKKDLIDRISNGEDIDIIIEILNDPKFIQVLPFLNIKIMELYFNNPMIVNKNLVFGNKKLTEELYRSIFNTNVKYKITSSFFYTFI